MRTQKNNEQKTFWHIVNNGDGTGTIDITGELLSVRRTDWVESSLVSQFYCPDDFKNDLAACSGLKSVTVNINSPGGDAYMGMAIHNALKALKCKVTTVIQGIAASAASIIFCAGDERLVYPGSCLMVHGASFFLDICGFVNEHGITEQMAELKQLKKALSTTNSCLAAVYAATTGKSEEECLAFVADNAEKYMTGAEALEMGFATGYADGQADPLKMVASAGKIALYSGSRLLSTDFHAPSNAKELGIKMESEKADMENKTQPPAGAEPLSAPVPAPAAEKAVDVKAALAADRKRMEAIETLAAKLGNSVDPALVAVAKYGNETQEPMTAEQFAVAAIRNFEPSNFLQTREDELAPANNVPVTEAKTEAPAGGLNPVVARFLQTYEQTHNKK